MAQLGIGARAAPRQQAAPKTVGQNSYKNLFGNISTSMQPMGRPDNAPIAYRNNSHFTPTISGPIKTDSRFADIARNQAMSRGAFAGDQRTYMGNMGPGIRAGSKMEQYRAGTRGDAEALQNFSEAQQEMSQQAMQDSMADLMYQERLAGEQAWIRDLLLDRDDTQNRDRMATYKRRADVLLGNYKRQVDDAVAKRKREAMLLSALI
jgi:hypothetical protein